MHSKCSEYNAHEHEILNIMKTLRRIKLNSLSQEDLADREMNALRGGIPVDVLVSKEQNLKLLTIVLM